MDEKIKRYIMIGVIVFLALVIIVCFIVFMVVFLPEYNTYKLKAQLECPKTICTSIEKECPVHTGGCVSCGDPSCILNQITYRENDQNSDLTISVQNHGINILYTINEELIQFGDIINIINVDRSQMVKKLGVRENHIEAGQFLAGDNASHWKVMKLVGTNLLALQNVATGKYIYPLELYENIVAYEQNKMDNNIVLSSQIDKYQAFWKLIAQKTKNGMVYGFMSDNRMLLAVGADNIVKGKNFDFCNTNAQWQFSFVKS